MDPQYVTAFCDEDIEDDIHEMVPLISRPLQMTSGSICFQRFELMERWVTQDRIDHTTLISAD